MESSVITVENISLIINDEHILNDISFSCEENSINAFLCPNNSGKTTLIKTLSGILYSDGGKILVNNILLSKKNFYDYILNISTILEDIDNQFLCQKVEDEIRYPLINLNYDFLEINNMVNKVSDVLKISDILGKDVSRLNNIEKIKVLLAASIVHKPKVLFIDDILRFLNKKEKKEILKLFKNIINEFSITIIFTTSDINDVIGLDNIYVLNKGNIVFHDSYENIIFKDNDLSKMGFSIPIMVDLSRKLEFYNLVDKIYYDKEKVVDILWK